MPIFAPGIETMTFVIERIQAMNGNNAGWKLSAGKFYCVMVMVLFSHRKSFVKSDSEVGRNLVQYSFGGANLLYSWLQITRFPISTV